jgi:hypothetical protein
MFFKGGKPIPIQQFRSEGHNSNRTSQASWAEQAQPSPSTLKGMKSPFAEKPPDLPGKPKIACLYLTSNTIILDETCFQGTNLF